MSSRDPFEEFTPVQSTPPLRVQPAAPPPDPFAEFTPVVPSAQAVPTDPWAEFSAPDVGPEEVSLVDKLESFGTSVLVYGGRIATAPFEALGGARITKESADWHALMNMSPEEQRREKISRGVDRIIEAAQIASKPLNHIPIVGDWIEAQQDDFRQKTGERASEAIADFSNRLTKLQEENIIPGFWTQDLPGAIGTTAGIGLAALASAVGSGGSVPAWAVAGFLGAALSADEAITDATAHGATPSQAQLAAAVGTVLGTTEALPITKVLDRVDTATGGVISRRINKVFQQKLVGSMLKEGLKGAFEEGLQEVTQQVGMDAVAAMTYDPGRGITDRMAEAATAGGGTGFILSALATSLGVPLRRIQQTDARNRFLKEEAEAVTGSPADLSTEGAITRNAPFSGLTEEHRRITADMPEILARMEEMTEQYAQDTTLTPTELRERGNQFVIGMNQERGRKTREGFIDALDQFAPNEDIEADLPTTTKKLPAPAPDWKIDYLVEDDEPVGLWGYTDAKGNQHSFEIFMSESGAMLYWNETPVEVFDTVEAAQIKAQEIAGVEVFEEVKIFDWNQALEKQPVIVAGFNEIKDWFAQLKRDYGAHASDPTSPSHGTALQYLEEGRRKVALELELAKEFKNMAAQLRKKYFSPDTRIILSGSRFAGKGNNGAMWSGENGRLIQIGLNLDSLGIHSDITTPNRIRARAREVFLHEFGHAIVNQRFNDIEARVKAASVPRAKLETYIHEARRYGAEGTARHFERILEIQKQADEAKKPAASTEDMIVYAAISKEYSRWLEKQLKNPFIERFKTISPPTSYATVDQSASEPTKQENVFGNEFARNDPGYWYNFDEFMAENISRAGTQHEIVADVVKGFFRKHRKTLEDLYAPYADLKTMPNVTDWLRLMSRKFQLAEKIAQAAKKQYTRYDFLRNPNIAKELGLDPAAFKGFQEGKDRYQKWYFYGLTIQQLAKLNRHIEPLQRYLRLARVYQQKISSFRWRGHETLGQWRKLGRDQANKLGQLLFEETINGTPATTAEFQAAGLSPEAVKTYARIKEDFNLVLKRIEQVLMDDARKNFYDNPVEMQHAFNRIKEELGKMSSKPFFPLIRFGRHTVNVRDNKGKLIAFYTFETRRERTRALREINSDHAGMNISMGYLSDSQVAVQGMQGPVLRALKDKLKVAGILDLDMQKAIEDLQQEALPIDSFRKHFAKRKKIAGYSEDAMRAYATYMMQAGNHLARIEMMPDLTGAVSDIQKDQREIAKLPNRDATKRGQIHEMTKDHMDYMLNPTNDWPMLRSIGFAWFMGFNLKSALVNATQTFVATMPYLAARYGDVATTKAMTRAIKITSQYWAGGKVDQKIADLLAIGKRDGWIDESLATELAVARSQKSLVDSLPITPGARTWSTLSTVMAWPFHTVEKMNRMLAAVAAHQLALEKGFSQTEAVALAREAVDSTQFEYARWARAKFMRGPIGSNLFLFKSYLQNMLFLSLGNDPASSRVLFSMLLMAGLMGLPFAEDLADLLDAAGTQLKKALGWSNPKVQSRVFLREMLLEMQMNPDLFMYGLSENSFGLGYLGDLAGAPVPEIDMQGSLSSGNILPGTQILKRIQEGELAYGTLETLEELGGAQASYMAGIAEALAKDNPDTWKRWESSLPAFLKSLSRAGRYATRGGEFNARGEPIAEFDFQDAQDQMELAAQALGFTPAEVSRGWEMMIADRERVTYYNAWRTSLLRNHNHAVFNRDSDSRRSALDEILDYNKMVPYPEMRIGSETIGRSLETFMRQRALSGQSIPQQESTYRLSKEIRDLYKNE